MQLSPADGKSCCAAPQKPASQRHYQDGLQTGRFALKTYAELATFGDYIFFKGSLASVVAEGRFDKKRSQTDPVNHAAAVRRRTCLSIVFNDLRRVSSNS
jgi:hypothetical protein